MFLERQGSVSRSSSASECSESDLYTCVPTGPATSADIPSPSVNSSSNSLPSSGRRITKSTLEAKGEDAASDALAKCVKRDT